MPTRDRRDTSTSFMPLCALREQLKSFSCLESALAKWSFGVLFVNWLSFGVERVAARQHFDPADTVATTLMNQQVFVLCDPNVADDPNARGDCPALEHLSVGVKTDQSVWLCPDSLYQTTSSMTAMA